MSSRRQGPVLRRSQFLLCVRGSPGTGWPCCTPALGVPSSGSWGHSFSVVPFSPVERAHAAAVLLLCPRGALSGLVPGLVHGGHQQVRAAGARGIIACFTRRESEPPVLASLLPRPGSGAAVPDPQRPQFHLFRQTGRCSCQGQLTPTYFDKPGGGFALCPGAQASL